MSGQLAGLAAHECRDCHGSVEPELVTIYPASDVCLDCMPRLELQKLQQELNQVQVLDRAALPEPPRLPGWEVGLHYRPSRILSGDFYDLRREENGQRLSLLLGDVMGKGIPAALLRTGLQGALRALAAEVDSPARVLEKTNRYFLASASPGRLASVFYGTLDLEGGTLRYANAGHLPPLVREPDGVWRTLETTGMVLGALDRVAYGEKTVAIDPGALFVLYSDGITEAENESGDFFEESRMTSVIEDLLDSPMQAVASAIADELARFAPGEPSDDRTLVMARRC
jgi:sigma-B regulation protein RsbU (phosphoserine phosphatase)